VLRLGRCSWPWCVRDLTIAVLAASGEAGLPCTVQRIDEARQRYRFWPDVSHCRTSCVVGWMMAEAPLDATMYRGAAGLPGRN
jgi:hypothetical protein